MQKNKCKMLHTEIITLICTINSPLATYLKDFFAIRRRCSVMLHKGPNSPSCSKVCPPLFLSHNSPQPAPHSQTSASGGTMLSSTSIGRPATSVPAHRPFCTVHSASAPTLHSPAPQACHPAHSAMGSQVPTANQDPHCSRPNPFSITLTPPLLTWLTVPHPFAPGKGARQPAKLPQEDTKPSSQPQLMCLHV